MWKFIGFSKLRWAPVGKSAEAMLAGVLTGLDSLGWQMQDDPLIGGIKVLSVLESLPKVGKVKARRLMDDIGIAHNRKIQGLGSQQRAALLEELGV